MKSVDDIFFFLTKDQRAFSSDIMAVEWVRNTAGWLAQQVFRQSLWFIPAGWLIMFYTNVFRIIALSLVLMRKPEYRDFSHDWILRPFFYVVIFALWGWWVEWFGGFFRKGAPAGV